MSIFDDIVYTFGLRRTDFVALLPLSAQTGH
jgi:hypothetical protein